MVATLFACLLLSQAPEQPPDHLRRAFAEVNRARAVDGLPPFHWSAKLAASAQELTDHGWATYTANPKAFGINDVHWDFGRRAAKYGVKAECGIGGSTGQRGQDGRIYPPDGDGWCHPWIHPDDAGRQAVAGLFGPNVPPTEPHVAAFHDGYMRNPAGKWVATRRIGFTHCGLAHSGGMTALNFGYQ